MTPQINSARGDKKQSSPGTPAKPPSGTDQSGKGSNDTAARSKAAITKTAGQPTASSKQQEAVFSLAAPSASEVCVAGEFTGWEKQPIKLSRDNGGVWQAKVPLPQGRHQYRFIVDGEWQDDPQCQECIANSFGSRNSVIQIG